MDQQNRYTFGDWLNNQFWMEKTYANEYVCNDSENYLDLVSMGKMTYEVLNKIQDEQEKAYEYMIKNTIETNERFFKRETAKSLDIKKVLEIKIRRIENYIKDNEELYYDIILPRLHRGIKEGAKFITAEQYLAYHTKQFLDAIVIQYTPYSLSINGKLVSFPTNDQMKYAQMEAKVLWLKQLKKFQSGNSGVVPLKQIFDPNKDGYFFCLELFRLVGFTDEIGNPKSEIPACEILGLIVALKETSHNLLQGTYSDDQLMEVMQNHFKVPFTPSIKRRGKGYKLTKDQTKEFINNFIKKARAV